MEIQVPVGMPPDEIGQMLLEVQDAELDMESVAPGLWTGTVHHRFKPLASFQLPQNFKAFSHDDARREALIFIFTSGLVEGVAPKHRGRAH